MKLPVLAGQHVKEHLDAIVERRCACKADSSHSWHKSKEAEGKSTIKRIRTLRPIGRERLWQQS
eukprot:3467857-Amphidinium_carterae.1